MSNIDLNLAPKKGYCLAYINDYTFVFDTYTITNNKIKTKNNGNIDVKKITKLHLFDEVKEYRIVKSSSNLDIIVNVLTKEEEQNINPLYLKTQEIYLDDDCAINNKTKIKVVNRFSFDENNCIYLENYRLAGLI